MIGDGYPTRVMGVINLSPESFYRGSVHENADEILEAVARMELDGADLIDIGGASTAPKAVYGTQQIDVETELERVEAAIEALDGNVRVPLSIDTTSSKVAEAALELGVDVVNDISGLQNDPEMVSVIREYSVPLIAMAYCIPHCKSVSACIASLQKTLNIAEYGHIDHGQIILDPGIGFGKPMELDLRILKSLNRFKLFGRPLLLGVSRKAFIGEFLNQERPEDRLTGSLAATAIAVSKGASIIRTHDVAETKLVVKLSDAVSGMWQKQTGRAELLDVEDERGIELLLERIGTRGGVRRALAKKGIMLIIHLRTISTPAALILKQEMLALGGDAAYHHDTIDFERKSTDVLLMGSVLQIGRLVAKLEKMDYFALPDIAEDIGTLLRKRTDEMNER
ncbi:dihydropteroate synthase [Candidatus Thorarchaeota archaeon]|nr:MAG: dihydropteroate synthase [Candidatus Thorarchaeota archaeon]